jgi:hypothetical protein
MMRVRRCLAAILFLASLAPASALAQVSDTDKATARQLTLDGYEALDKKDWATAADRFTRADGLYHAPTVTLGLARAQVGLGKLVTAQELYSRVVHETIPANASAAFTRAVDDARRELDALTPRVPSVVITVKGSAAPKVTVDGVEVPNAALGVKRPADPGKHVVRAQGVGVSPVDVTVTLVEGKSETVAIELKPGPGGLPPAIVAPPPPPPGVVPLPPQPNLGPATPPPGVTPDQGGSSGSPRKTIGFAGIGVGAAGLVLGGVMGGLALGKHADLLKTCPLGHCIPGTEGTNQANIDSYHTFGLVSTIGFIAGGALAATGVILVVTAPKAKTTATVTPLIGLGYLGAQGSF